MKVRPIAARIESLRVAPFVALVAAIGGVLRSLPASLMGSSMAVAVFIVCITYAALILLWWLAVRRRQFSVRAVAWHLVAALALADLFAFVLSLAWIPVNDRGDVVRHLSDMPPSSLIGAFVPPILILGVIRFVVASVLIGVGRLLPGSGKLVDRHHLAPTHPGAVT